MKASKVLNVIISIILWVVIVVAALFAFTTLATRDSNKVANLFGFTPLTVQSDSMVPTFSAGDMIIIKKCNTADLKEGDIITFHTIIQNQYVLNTHRIAAIDSNGSVRSYTTKGDNNQIADSHVISDGDIVGKYVTKIGGFGKVIDFLSSSMGFLLCIVLPMLLFFAYEVYHLIVISIQLKKATALEAAQEAQAANADVDAKLAEMQRLAAEAEAKLAEARRLAEEKKSE